MAIASDSFRRARPLLGTFVEIEVTGAAEARMAAAVEAAFEAIADVHRLMSFHEADSDVSRLNREAALRPTAVHAWTFRVLEVATDLNRRSNGAFDIALAPVLQRMGLLPQTARDGRTGALAADSGAGSRDAIELLDGPAVRFHRPDIAIDLDGIAKGFAVDRGLEVLKRFDIPCGIVNAGGDLATFGTNPHTIDIRDPRNPGRIICSVEVANQALASSARRFDPFHTGDTTSSAVIDPVSLRPAHAVDGVSVRAPSCMIADALTKLVMICGTDAGELLEHYDAAALVIAPDGNLQITSTWHHAVFLAA
jgi:thiamine biosynthesis lipoprotein